MQVYFTVNGGRKFETQAGVHLIEGLRSNIWDPLIRIHCNIIFVQAKLCRPLHCVRLSSVAEPNRTESNGLSSIGS